MKIIKSSSYMRKEAIWSQMPVGDSNLPGQLTEQDIGGGLDDDTSSNQGSSEIEEGTIYYRYNYDYNYNEVTDIQAVKVISRQRGKIVDPYELEILVENNESLIKNDIEILEEDAKIERQPGYGQSEYEPEDIGF